MKYLLALPLLALGAAASALPAGAADATLPVQCPDAARPCGGAVVGEIACRCPLQKAPCQTHKCDARAFVRASSPLSAHENGP